MQTRCAGRGQALRCCNHVWASRLPSVRQARIVARVVLRDLVASQMRDLRAGEVDQVVEIIWRSGQQ